MNELDLFIESLGRTDPAERAAFLDQACAGNPELRQRLEELLTGHARGSSPLDRPPVAPDDFGATADLATVGITGEERTAGETETVAHADSNATTDAVPAVPRYRLSAATRGEGIGAVIAGRYTLIELIGEGGMGSVYRADQTEPVKRQVALKLIKTGMDSRGVLARFDAERQALALMDHPNIARIYDGMLAHILGHRGRRGSEVLEMAKAAANGLERTLGPDNPNTLGTLDNLASAFWEAGRLPEAIALFERVRDARIAKLGPDHPDTLITLSSIATTYQDVGKLPEAIALFERVRDAQIAKLGPDHPSTLTTLLNLARAYKAAGRFPEAIALFERARDGLIAKLGPDHTDTLTALHNLASAYQDVFKVPEAIALFERVRDAQIAKLGPDHPATLTTLQNLAGAFRSSGRLPEAIALFERVRDAQIAKLGPDHPSTLTTLHNLALAYQSSGRLPEAIALFESARDAFTAKLGPDHFETLTTLQNLAGAYQAVGKVPEAIALFERVRDAQIAKLGPDHPATLTTLDKLAVAYWWAKQLDKSVPLFEDVLKRKEAKLGRQHPETQGTVANLGVNYKDAGRLKEAIPLLEEAYRAAKSVPPLRWVANPLIDAYMKAGENSTLADLLHEQLAEARNTLPKDSPQLASALAQIGLILLQQKEWAAAEPLLRESLIIREKSQPNHWSTFSIQSALGGNALGQKKYAEAEPMLLAGYEGMKQREATIPQLAKVRLPQALDSLIELFTATNKPDDVKKWQAERAKYPKPN
jgi:eukaryotic-like serine/threonine-protein kinase